MPSISFIPNSSLCSVHGLPRSTIRSFNKANNTSSSLSKRLNSDPSNGGGTEFRAPESSEPARSCFCGRRHFIEASTLGTSIFPIRPSNAADSHSDYRVINCLPCSQPSISEYSKIAMQVEDALNKFHPPRPDWYEEFYALVLNRAAESYEAEVARYKSQIFSKLRGKAQKILEIGIGTGPNLRYYASNSSDVEVVGIDPNQKTEKYARSSAASAGLPPSNFEFIHAVGEAIPLSDASVDAVVGTLVLCSVKDVDMTLKEMKRVLRPGGLYLFVEHVGAKDGSILRFLQRILDPLQQTLADGCHLTRDTGNIISTAGFSSVELNMAFLSKATFINPHVYGIAYK